MATIELDTTRPLEKMTTDDIAEILTATKKAIQETGGEINLTSNEDETVWEATLPDRKITITQRKTTKEVSITLKIEKLVQETPPEIWEPGMNLSIDDKGRFVLPRIIVDQLQLNPNQTIYLYTPQEDQNTMIYSIDELPRPEGLIGPSPRKLDKQFRTSGIPQDLINSLEQNESKKGKTIKLYPMGRFLVLRPANAPAPTEDILKPFTNSRP